MPPNNVEHLTAAAFPPKPNLVFVDVFGLHPLYDKFYAYAKQGNPLPNIVLSGGKGIGKTLSLQAWAGIHSAPIIAADCSADMRRPNLVGYTGLRGDQTPFICGPLTTAIEVANETGFAILVLEELNSLSAMSQKILNGLLDFRRSIEVTEAGRVFELKPGALLWVFGTMNAGYGGTVQLNEDLVSRLDFIPLPYPTESSEFEIVKANLPKTTVKDTEIAKVIKIAHQTRQNAMGYSLAPRDVVQIIRNIEVVGLKVAFLMASGKFEGSGRDTFQQRVNSTWAKTF